METKNFPKIGIGVLIVNEEGKYLLGLRQGSHGAGEWSFPGGHLDWGETMTESAKREIREETGLEVDEFELISIADELKYINTDNKHYVNIGFKGKYKGGEPRIMEPERWLEWRWFAPENLPENLFEGVRLILNNYRQGKIY